MKKLMLIILFVFPFSMTLLSQSYFFETKSFYKLINPKIKSNLEGSPFLFQDWLKGSILMNNGDLIKSIKLRYDVYRNEMQFQSEDNTYVIGSPEDTKTINIGNHSFIYINYTENGNSKQSYFEVLNNGKWDLLAQYYCEIIPSDYNVAIDAGSKNDRIAIKKRYFFRMDNKVFPIDKKGKNFISSFGEKSQVIKKFVREKKLSFKNEEDLLEIAYYINSNI